MALTKLVGRPGVNREGTNYSNEGGWYACDKVRFRAGFPEKIGGWRYVISTAFLGVCRMLWNWMTISGNNLIALGTNWKYYLFASGAYNDITPLRDFVSTGTYSQVASTTITITITSHTVTTGDTVTLWFSSGTAPNGEYVATDTGANTFTVQAASGTSSGNVTLRQRTVELVNPFTTTNGSTTVRVAHTSHGALDNDYVTFTNYTGFNNIPTAELNAQHQITFISGNAYDITVTTAANASSAGGGTGQAQYQINTGLTDFVQGVGWGADPYNASTTAWGQSAAIGPGGQIRLWTNDNFGQNLLLAARGGPIYYWEVSSLYVFPRAVYLADAAFADDYDGQFVPTATNQIMSSPVQRIVIAFGANSYDANDSATTFDPMLVRWSDQENPYQWVPSSDNQAGEQRLTNGSFIVQARATRQEILIWTDTALHSMQYNGPPYWYGFTLLADNISCMSPNAAVSVNNMAFWMGHDKFYQYSGRVETLPCTLWRHVFRNININQAFKVVAGSNEGFNEVWWFYPSADSTENDSYVIYNYADNIWYYGSLARTAWLDSPLQSNPLATSDDSILLYHEYGVDDNKAEPPTGISAYIHSSDFDIGDGNNYMFVWRTIPDITFDGSTDGVTPTATLGLYPRNFPGAADGTPVAPTITGAVYPLTTYTNQLMTRFRGRQMSVRIGSSAVGTNWQLGAIRIDARPDGRKS